MAGCIIINVEFSTAVLLSVKSACQEFLQCSSWLVTVLPVQLQSFITEVWYL